MSPYLRKVRTASGAMAVRIMAKEGGVRRIVEHPGSAHDQAELVALMEVGRRRIAQAVGQGMLDLGACRVRDDRMGAVVEHQCSALLWQVLTQAYERLGLQEAAEDDDAFMPMVLARLVEPTSKAQVLHVLTSPGVTSTSRRSLFRSLAHCVQRGYREGIAATALTHAAMDGDLSLCLYDVTTLYFEVDKEDDLRKVGLSKERRVDPQIIVGLLVDRAASPCVRAAGKATRPRRSP